MVLGVWGAFCICQDKGTDQLRDNQAADQGLCFSQKDSIIPLLLNLKFRASSHILHGFTAWFVSGLVGNPGDSFSLDTAFIVSFHFFSGTMADDLMDFSEFDGDENDENADPDVEHAPTLMQTPVVKNSILKQSTKDNLIQLFTPVNKSRKLKVSTGE